MGRYLPPLATRLCLVLLLAACAPAAPPSPTSAPAKPAATTAAPAPATPAPTAAPAKPAEKPAAAPPAPAPTEAPPAKPAAAPAAKVRYPDKPIEVIVTFAPGGAADSAARSLTPFLSRQLGQPIAVKNSPPPRTGTDVFSRSRPDGYTLGVLSPAAVASDETFFEVRWKGQEFEWIAASPSTPSVLFTNARAGLNSLDDLARLGQQRPVKIGAFSVYSSSTLANVLAFEEKKIPYAFVTGFDGAGPAMTALIRGEVDVVGTTLGTGIGFYKSGDARALLLLQNERHEQVPDALTLKQAGLSDEVGALGAVVFALVAPPRTPREILDVLAAAHEKVAQDPEYSAQLKKAGFDLVYMPTDKTVEYVKQVYAGFQKVKPIIEKQVKPS